MLGDIDSLPLVFLYSLTKCNNLQSATIKSAFVMQGLQKKGGKQEQRITSNEDDDPE